MRYFISAERKELKPIENDYNTETLKRILMRMQKTHKQIEIVKEVFGFFDGHRENSFMILDDREYLSNDLERDLVFLLRLFNQDYLMAVDFEGDAVLVDSRENHEEFGKFVETTRDPLTLEGFTVIDGKVYTIE
jgi:hypothetical protein